MAEQNKNTGQKTSVVFVIKEGISKGGVNDKPSTQRPVAQPQGQGTTGQEKKPVSGSEK